MRVDGALGEGVAGLDELALLHRHVGVARDRVLPVLVALALDHDPALAADGLGDADAAVDLGHHGRVLRLAGLEELDDARQTTGDVLGLRHLARDLGQNVAGRQVVALVHREVGADGELVAPRLPVLAAATPDHLDGRNPLAGAQGLDDDLVRVAGELVDLLTHVLALDEVVELHLAGDRGQDRRGEGVPLDERGARVDLVAVLDQEVRAVGHRVALLLALAVVEDDQLAGPGDGDRLAVLVVDRRDIEELDAAGVIGDVA